MTEVIKNSGIDKGNDYDSEIAKINNDLSELKEFILKEPDKESENQDLPEWFEYDSDGCIICKNSSFTSEDYENHPTPIEKVLWWKMKEWEYRWIDYSWCAEWSMFLKYDFLMRKDSHIVGVQNSSVLIIKWMKIISPDSKRGQYIRYVSYNESPDDKDFWSLIIIMNRMRFITELNNFWISFEDISNFLWGDKSESEIFDIMKESINDDIDWDKKNRIFWEFADKIESINLVSWLKRAKIKEKFGDTKFYEYISKFVNRLDCYNWKTNTIHLFNRELPDFLLSPSCPITNENIDNYINCVNEGGHFDVRYTIEEQKSLVYYGIENFKYRDYDIIKEKLKKIEVFKSRWITKDMASFVSFDFNYIEELFVNGKEWKNLFNYLSKYPQKLKNLWWIEIKEIDLNTNERNFCFRWILEMIKSRWDMEVLPYPWEDADENNINKRKQSWEKVIKEYEDFLRYYIWKDFYTNRIWKRKQIDRKESFDTIFYSNAVWEEDIGNATGTLWNTLKMVQSFSKSKVLNYSSIIDKNWKLDQSNQKKLVNDVCEYAKQNPNQKILVYIWAHWSPDGSSGNWWEKEDWLKISKYPNVKVMSIRCYFWSAYTNRNSDSASYIYNQESPVSWFSNMEETSTYIAYWLKEWFEKWLWFHELELYTRLNYRGFSPLTDEFEYRNRKTWKIEKKNVWLSYEWEKNVYGNNA